MRILIFTCFLFLSFALKANDSLVILTAEQYINTIVKNHPEAKQAKLLLQNDKVEWKTLFPIYKSECENSIVVRY